jgi:hypothetical protein
MAVSRGPKALRGISGGSLARFTVPHSSQVKAWLWYSVTMGSGSETTAGMNNPAGPLYVGGASAINALTDEFLMLVTPQSVGDGMARGERGGGGAQAHTTSRRPKVTLLLELGLFPALQHCPATNYP